MGSLTSGDTPSLHKFIKYNRHMGIKSPIVKKLHSDYLMTPIIEKTTSHEALDGVKVNKIWHHLISKILKQI
uniref:Uncharacterized protein n=1 Tax=Panagrolaimus superbus TaxID=310955 RepID=A0A914XZE8_9BILA